MKGIMEPASTTVAGGAAIKFGIISGVGAFFAAVVVMCMTLPSTKKEWAAGLISTVVGSVLGGAFVVQRYHLEDYANQGFFGLAALAGVMFTAGLPLWVVVRAFFRYTELNKDRSLLDLIVAVKQAIWTKNENK